MRSDTSSHTARLVARSLFLASKDERLSLLLAPQAAELLARISGVASGWFGVCVRRSWLRRVMFGIERLALPGVIAHYLVRKLGIETEVRKAIAAGAGRVVVIGAGFDTLAWRLHREFPEVEWIEVDHPATQAIKARSLEQAPNLKHLPHDLVCPRPLSQMLDEGSVPTVILIEGVTMYLTKEKVAELLKDCARLAGPQGRVILTFMEMDDRGSIDFRGQNRVVRWWLSLCAEPFLWGVSRRDLKAFLKDCGLGNERVIDHSGFRESFLAPRGLGGIPLAEGECLCVCSPIHS
jgi:methyltransferase (TIGR00027 family)